MSSPRLRPDLVLVEQSYRGEQSYIVKDPATHKYFRFRPVEAVVMQSLDGRPVEEAVASLAEQGIRVTVGVVEKFAAKLRNMGLCERTLQERSSMLVERLRAERKQRLRPPLFKGDLLRMRWSVGDPDHLFDVWKPRLHFFFTRPGVLMALALFAIYFVVLAVKWDDFVRVLSALFSFDLRTVIMIYVAFTFVAAVHELGHGVACKEFGGEVHEIGAMLFYFDLAFFCNVNDAWGFTERAPRLWVSAAGSWIQLMLASLAGVVWWATPAGTLLSDFAQAVFVIGGILTVVLNVNPLIPLDGYYALMDYLEVPNLRPRAFAYLVWAIKHRVLGLDVPEPPADEREQRIFLRYGILAALYSGFIFYTFAGLLYGWVEHALGVLGIIFFMAGLWLALRGSIREFGGAAVVSARRRLAAFRGRRRDQLLIAAAAVLVIGVLVPRPITVTGRFAAAPALSIPLTAAGDGMVDRVMVREGSRVAAGMPVLEIRNLPLERSAAAAQRTADSLASREAQARARGRLEDAALYEAERLEEASRLSGMRAELAALRIRAIGRGVVMTARPEMLAGTWVEAGDRMLELGQPDSVELRIALTGAGASLVRPGQPLELISHADPGTRVQTHVGGVSTAAADRSGSLEARVRQASSGTFRPGMTGEASIILRRSNLWGSLWWSLRRRVRTDILL
ncbi:MAG TPA: HlyD family efflux transporter periplasmic adaptor subunit [Gemmatimonadales bacterium]|nr:HlyD family efflux transporter periplasmic adaptor subunit [Gemmatimonadales bacterium]